MTACAGDQGGPETAMSPSDSGAGTASTNDPSASASSSFASTDPKETTSATDGAEKGAATTAGADPAGTTSTTEPDFGDGSLFVDDGDPGDADYRYVIPFGAGEALDAGEPLEILPATLEVQVGETIEIVNEDDRGHLVGPFFVGEGETLRQRFASPGEFIGMCSVHPSGELRLIVRDA